MAKGWTKSDWRAKPRIQMPDYPDQSALNGVEAQLAGEALLSVLEATFHGGATIEVLGGDLDRRPMDVAEIRMEGASTTVTLLCSGAALRLN